MKWKLEDLKKGHRYAIRRPAWEDEGNIVKGSAVYGDYVEDVGMFTGNNFKLFDGKHVFWNYCEIRNEIPLEYWSESERIRDINKYILQEPCVLCEDTGINPRGSVEDWKYFCSCNIGVKKKAELIESKSFKELLESYRKKGNING